MIATTLSSGSSFRATQPVHVPFIDQSTRALTINSTTFSDCVMIFGNIKVENFTHVSFAQPFS
jgi:hypothetical protein